MFKIIKNYFRNQKAKQKAGSARPVYADTTYLLSKSLDRNTSELKKVFGDSDDLTFREFYFGVRKQIKALVFFIDGLGDQKLILDSIVKSLMVDSHIMMRKADGSKEEISSVKLKNTCSR